MAFPLFLSFLCGSIGAVGHSGRFHNIHHKAVVSSYRKTHMQKKCCQYPLMGSFAQSTCTHQHISNPSDRQCAASSQHQPTFPYQTIKTLCSIISFILILFFFFAFCLDSTSAFVKREISLARLVKVWSSEPQTEQ